MPEFTAAAAASPPPAVAYRTSFGEMIVGSSEHILESELGARYKGQVQLIFTSPPFPLNRKKRYGNSQGTEYLDWLAGFKHIFSEMLVPDGSLVIELGNAWEPGRPVMSTLALKALLQFVDDEHFVLCQQFVCHNPARLPSPAQWVNVERIRVTDAFTHVWWLGKTARPKANNRHVLRKYSAAMEQLLESGQYNAGERPSEHNIGHTSFLRDNGGAIPSNVLTFANTAATDDYRRYCKKHGLQPHPARMPIQLAEFFVNFLTDPGDLVFDPFAGSNTTGSAAERLRRRWVAVELDATYADGSRGRFPELAGRSEPPPES